METLEVIGFAGVFGDRLVPLCWNHSCIGVVLIRMEPSLFTVHLGQVRPQLFRAFTTTISDMKCDHLARLLVHGSPDPLPVGLPLHKAPHLVGFRLKTPHDHITWGCNRLYMQMTRQRLKAGNHEVDEPPDTDPNGAADAVQRDVLAEYASYQGALFFVHHTVVGVQDGSVLAMLFSENSLGRV